jgi:F-box-like
MTVLLIFHTIQGTCLDTEQSPNLTINSLPDEVLLDMFDSYRQSTECYDYLWRNKYAWFNLAHVCRRWRTVMFASSSRLDLNVIMGPQKPGNIKTILSSHLPIIIDYTLLYGRRDVTGSVIWRMHAALRHRDRVREISLLGRYGDIFRKFIKATDYHFPALESLVLCFPHPHRHKPDIPATSLRGPDRSDLPLRHLGLYGGSLAYVSGLLLSATALTDLTLNLTTPNATDFDPSQGSSLLAYLQGMQCLRNLVLTTPFDPLDFQSEYQNSVPKDTTVPMLELTRLHYYGLTTFLNNLMSGLSAPSLQDAYFGLCTIPLLYLSRVVDDVREDFQSVSVAFDMPNFYLLSSPHSGEIDHFEPGPSFRLNVNCSPYTINLMNSTGTPSTKLALAEELTLNFPSSNMAGWMNVFSMRDFLRQFRSVRVLRVNPFVREIGLYLRQDDDGEAIFPVLEQVEISISHLKRYSSDEEYELHVAEARAAFEPCERAGRLVKVYYCQQTKMQFRNGRG